MTIFDGYARYYDLLYRDKDYAAEANYVHEVIQKHLPGASTVTVLELGCGTGVHAFHLVKLGYIVHGVDQSRSMLDQAAQRKEKLSPNVSAKLQFSHGDIRRARLADKFDAVIALFHVMSYLPETKDIEDAFNTACHHLRPGGIMFFDAWYGPAVLSDRPAVRVKRIADEHTDIVRIAEPSLYANQNIVDVHYEVFVRDRLTGQVEIFQETHRMRYLFKSEVELLMRWAGMNLTDCFEWMTSAAPGCNTWGVSFLGKKL